MRVALVSDLHGCLVALETVVDRLRHDAPDAVICLGDVATLGTRPSETVALVRHLGWPWILGNHDEFLFAPELVAAYTRAPAVRDAIDWSRERLSAEEVEYAEQLPREYWLDLERGASLWCFHGSPRSHSDDVLATTPAALLEEWWGGRRATVCAGGHTHVQLVRQHRGDYFVNPGSVGLPFREYVAGAAPELLPHAEYALLDSDAAGLCVSLRRVEVDARRARAAITDTDHPLREQLLAPYR